MSLFFDPLIISSETAENEVELESMLIIGAMSRSLEGQKITLNEF